MMSARAVRWAGLPVAVVILLSGCTTGDGGGAIAPSATAPPAGGGTVLPAPGGSSPPGTPPGVDRPTVAEKIDAELQVPWSTVFLPDGTAVISERETARLRSIAPGSGSGPAGTVGEVPDVDADREGGLLGLALSPDFARDRYLYAYYTSAGDNRVARLRLEERAGELELGPSEVIFTGIPKAATHNGGGSGSGRTATSTSAPAIRSAAGSPRTRTRWAERSCASPRTGAPRRAIPSPATRCTVLATATSRDSPGTAPAGCGRANSAPTSTTSST